jgi:hypothetical protein
MAKADLDRLVDTGTLSRESPSEGEVAGLRRSGAARLADADNASLALESRFDLTYNAAHALALAALRRLGYRSANRYAVFQVLPHTLGIAPEQWRVLAKAHEIRNRTEYEGILDIGERLVADMVAAAKVVQEALRSVEG